MPEKISIIRDSGETLNSNVVALFTIPDSGKQYIITTENAVDPHGLTVLHVSEIVEDRLKKIATDEEWSSIKTIMRAIISGSVGSYQFIPTISTAKADVQYSRDISVSAAASKQIIESYMSANPKVSDGGEVVNSVPLDVDEIIPGITEVVDEPKELVNNDILGIGNAVTNIPSSAIISQPVDINESILQTAKVEEQNIEQQEVVSKSDEVKESNVSTVSNDVPAAVVNVQTPVVAYVDPAFQQLLTSDYNQILMHVQSINNNINQIASMPALNYQPSYNINQNGVANFNSNASVDEIIVGSTEVFNEGVKNLVATITEKIYRDLFQREADLAKREAILLERERMLNEQLAQLSASLNLQNVAVVSAPVAQVAAPVDANVAQTYVQQTVQVPVAEVPAAELQQVPVAQTVPVVQEVNEVQTAPVAVITEVPVVEQQMVNAVEQPTVSVVEQPTVNVVDQSAVSVAEQPVVNVVEVPVRVEPEAVVENTVPAQQNTAPVAEPAPVVVDVQPEVQVSTSPVINTVPQPIQTVEVV